MATLLELREPAYLPADYRGQLAQLTVPGRWYDLHIVRQLQENPDFVQMARGKF